MKATYPALLAIGMLCSAPGHVAPGESNLSDQIRKAIEEFNRKKSEVNKPENEVVVVLAPPGWQADEEPPAQAISVAEPDPEEETAEPEPAPEEPKLITGKPPAGKPAEQPEEHGDTQIAASEPEAATPAETDPVEQQGLGIRVESIRDGEGKVDPGQVKLKANFPAKVLSRTPDGWNLEKSGQAPAFREEVTLRPGKTISLSIRPHVLAPASDGMNTFSVVEPGFDASEGYRQSNTVSAILGNSVAQLDRDALLLGNAITDLQQLLSSLPKPEPEPATEEPSQP